MDYIAHKDAYKALGISFSVRASEFGLARRHIIAADLGSAQLVSTFNSKGEFLRRELQVEVKNE
jgi:hypothetical protein